MPAIAKKKTKMIVKDGNGDYLQLLPETEVDAELDEESSNPVASSAVAESLSSIQSAASNTGAIKVMDEEPTALNTAEYAGETLIAWVQPEQWQYTVTAASHMSAAGVPFSLDGQNASITVDWGDGTRETFTSENAQYKVYPRHYYNDSRDKHTITIESRDFSKIYYDSPCTDYEDYDYYGSYAFALTLYSIDSPLPKLAGSRFWNWQTNKVETLSNGLVKCFWNIPYLERVVPDIFVNNPNITSVWECFKYCDRLSNCTFHISSPSITDCRDFITNVSSHTIYVPSGSATQTTFQTAYGSSQNVTIIGE